MPNSPHPDLRLEVHPPSTPPTRSRARSTSPTHTTPSAGPSRPLSPNPRFTASPRLDQSPILGRDGYEPARGGGGLAGIGRAIAQRVLRAVRRGNLPFMLVFITYVLIPHGDRRAWHLIRRCVIVFFTSLAGIGYVPPDEIETTVAFLPGTPVFDLAGRQAQERRMEEQRVLEESWAKKKRPKDGAWMQRARDDKAFRRNKSAAPTPSATIALLEGLVGSEVEEVQKDGDPLS